MSASDSGPAGQRPENEEEWISQARSDLERDAGEDAQRYQQAAPLWQCYAGLRRYWDKRDG